MSEYWSDMMEKRRYSLKAMVALALFASAFTCMAIYFAFGRELGVFTPRFESTRRYGALLHKLEELYIGDYDNGEITDEALRGAVYALGDDWSYYMSANELEEYNNYSYNQYAGIGVEIDMGEDYDGMLVLSVYPDSPAERAGIAVSDIIIAVDGASLAGLTLDEIDVLVDREIGQSMELTLLHEDGTTSDVICEYEYVYKDPVSYMMLSGDIGYISLLNFEYGSASGFISAVEELRFEGARAFIYDMRNNGGGKVTEMTKMLDYLLPEGEIFIHVDRSGSMDITYSDGEFLDMPAVVLVNAYSYSAAEYFTVMLSDYGYATTVGEHTTGKNRSQITVDMPGGGALHISTAQYLTKNRISLYDTNGYAPNFEIPMTDDQYALLYYGRLETADDPQLKKAMELLAG